MNENDQPGRLTPTIEVDPNPGTAWDAFVEGRSGATPYHLSAWATILRAAYRFRPCYMVLHGPQGEIDGVLPLVERGGLISGSRLNSLPVVRSGGPLARTREQEVALIEAACGLVRAGRADQLSVYSTVGGYESMLPGLMAHDDDPPSWPIPLTGDPQSYLEHLKGRSKSRLRDIAKAERSGLAIREGSSRKDLRHFYRLYLGTMKKHRLLPRSYRQLSVAMRLLAPRRVFRLVLVEHEGTPVAGGIFHLWGDGADLLYNGSDDRYYDLRPNHALYWWMIQRCIQEGYGYLDLGLAVRGSSLAEFKRRWGAEPLARFRYTYPAREGGGSGNDDSERSVGLAWRLARDDRWLVARAWKRAPLFGTRIAGTIAYRYL
jgi:Acetyltransferase (GNAT) domain